MSAATRSSDDRRYRLATNDNEIVVEDEAEDVEGHRLATNDNETIVPSMRRVDPSDEDEGPTALGARRMRAR